MIKITAENKLISITTTGYLCLSFYVFGCLVLENNVNYATWHLIRKEDFGAYHQQLEKLLQPYFFLPMLLQLLFNIAFIWLHPPQLKRGLIILVFLLNAYIIAESLLIQVPIHQALEHNKSELLLNQLIDKHLTYRLPSEILGAVFNILILNKIIMNKSAD